MSRSYQDVVAIDGKRIRRSYDTRAGKSAIHMVSAFASGQGVCLGQVSTDEKSNEITAIPKLLKKLDIKGCTVTIDALGCQTAIAEADHKKRSRLYTCCKGQPEGFAAGHRRYHAV